MDHKANGIGFYKVLLMVIQIKYSLTIIMDDHNLIISKNKINKDKNSKILCQALAYKRNRKISTSPGRTFLSKIKFIKIISK